ncbi:MAG: hypothetical protein LBD48_04010, partial [Treponema sp.]|nr:hypothetical protein [Treponema sp.]
MKEKEPKKTKPAKAPGALRKPLKKKTFERRFAKYIEHPGDRKFFVSCFTEKDEIFTINEGLGKEDVKKLKGLLKAIKQNRKGAVKLVPLVFAAIVITALVVFFTVFANPLLERVLEKGLEAVFEARSDVDNFRLSLIRFRIAIGGITVAN